MTPSEGTNWQNNSRLVLNIVPIKFHAQKLIVGLLDPLDKEGYRKLRDNHWKTHAFRFDRRVEKILNIPIVAEAKPLGELKEVELQEHLLLLARAIQRKLLVELTGSEFGVSILREDKLLMFWGQTDQARLLSRAVKKENLGATPGLEVMVRYEIDCRMFRDSMDVPYLGLVIDIGTSNIIDIAASELLKRGFPLVGKYVSQRSDSQHDFLQPRLRLLGRVTESREEDEGVYLLLTDTSGTDRIRASEALLEPRLENLHEVVALYYGENASRIITALETFRQPLATALGKLDRIKATRNRLSKINLVIADQIKLELGELLTRGDAQFPEIISTDRPTLLFGAQGRNRHTVPDFGITDWGPYMYMQHERNTPLIGVICQSRFRGRVELFMKSLQEGYPSELWTNQRTKNPYPNGLVGKFRLVRIRVEYEECSNNSASAYREAVKRLLDRLPETPDLAIVQIEGQFDQLHGDANPYFVTKAAFMTAGVPTQSIQIEKIDTQPSSVAYILNSLALAIYAKLDGIPWVIATLSPTTHELVIGLGSADVAAGRLGKRTRYIGITTVFQGDGRYLIWGTTKEVEFEQYADALLESLRVTVRFVQQQNAWLEGDRVRLVCHVYKRLRDCEARAIKALVKELLDKKYIVEFAFLDISTQHPYYIFDPSQKGVPYQVEGRHRTKGKGVTTRGLCLQLDNTRGLLHLTGPRDIKTEEQGNPQPLLVELHPDSDFTDMAYLLRQIYHFSYMSWRSFMPGTEPVTITYSRLIARLLGNLKSVEGWNSAALTVGTLRSRRWFI